MNTASVGLTYVDATVTSHENALQLLQMRPQVENCGLPEELRTLDKPRLVEER